MKVKFLVSVGGLDFAYQAGDIYEIEKEEAVRFINGGIAEEVKEKKGK